MLCQGGGTLHTTHELAWVEEGVLYEALVYIIYIRERYCSSLVCTFNAYKPKGFIRNQRCTIKYELRTLFYVGKQEKGLGG